ncbi:nephrin-like protein [Leptotrombidium deliense]|uniref:Nephrin-like protein n=1 Tax=Leptotrombidium deliense TaxID=299467 RepID=A0A443SN97_9ACAR|nr:nephrin-like protein [Leptotrombidium deliense]
MLCDAENEVGKLKEPCIFSIIPAGPPERVNNCKITNHSMSTLFLDCTPGDSNGLRQIFVLEVYNTLSSRITANYSNPTKPLFLVNNLPAGTSFTLIVYAVNAKGKSSPVSLVTSTLAEPEKQMSHESIDQLTLNPLLIVLIAFVGIMVVISITVVIIIRIRNDRYDNINGEGMHTKNTENNIFIIHFA